MNYLKKYAAKIKWAWERWGFAHSCLEGESFSINALFILTVNRP